MIQVLTIVLYSNFNNFAVFVSVYFWLQIQFLHTLRIIFHPYHILFGVILAKLGWVYGSEFHQSGEKRVCSC
jgi:hypothetical protein